MPLCIGVLCISGADGLGWVGGLHLLRVRPTVRLVDLVWVIHSLLRDALEDVKCAHFTFFIYVKGVLGENGTSYFGGFGGEFCTLWGRVEGEVF
jgi:hypothetical protein